MLHAERGALADAARYRHPVPGWPGTWIESSVHMRWWTTSRRRLTKLVPLPVLASDVSDVVYLNWWVDPEALPAVPAGYRYWVRDGHTPFTILTYRHGHFGPAILGAARKIFPSPLQSNWRWYVQRDTDPDDAVPTVLFARNIMSSLAHVVGARLSSDAMQPHLPKEFVHRQQGVEFETWIAPGHGSAPALESILTRTGNVEGDVEWWSGRFAGREEALRFLCCQDSAISVSPDGSAGLARIHLSANTGTIVPLAYRHVRCPLLGNMGCDSRGPFCFLLPYVPFKAISEQLLFP